MALTDLSAEIVIIGSGAGGGTMAYALKDADQDVLILERGEFLPVEAENWSPDDTITRGRYKPNEYWEYGRRRFRGSNQYNVGGMTKMFGACLARIPPQAFDEYGLDDGPSPAWPIDYTDLEPYYNDAEKIWGVRGMDGDDPMAPPRSAPFPYPPLAHEPEIERLATRLRDQGLHPYTLSMGIDYGAGGRCIRCHYCGGFTCPLDAKCDADIRCVRPALKSPSVSIQTGAYVERLITDQAGRRVVAAEARIGGELRRVVANTFFVCAGGVNTAALFLRSSSSAHPDGLANASGMVGRNYTQMRGSAVMGIDPRRSNPTVFQKTLGVNDFYLSPDGKHPRLGTLQTLGKVLHQGIRGELPWIPPPVAKFIAGRSIDWWVMTEDCPLPQNRVVLAPHGGIRIEWRPTSGARHRKLVSATARMMRRAGYPVVVWKGMGLETNTEQSGTMRMGEDPSSSVVDPICRVHVLENVYVVDASVFPSIGAGPGGPTLTIAAMALRLADKTGLARNMNRSQQFPILEA